MIEAQNLLVQMRLSDYPNTKKEDKKSWHRSTLKQAYPNQKSTTEMTTKELANFLRAKIRG